MDIDAVIADVKNGDAIVIGVLVGILVGILTLFVLVIAKSGRNKRQGVLLLGLCDAGKTLMYSQLMFNGHNQTYTSVKPNIGDYTVMEKNKKVRLIDLPGHERIRGLMLNEYKTLTRAIVFVIDSGTLQKELKEVAEFLYTVLSDPTISNIAPPVLILCNKQDLTLAKGAKVIRSQLEKEMNTLRITRAAALQGVGDTDDKNAFLGKRDKDFDFADLKPFKIEFAECSALGESSGSNGADLDSLHTWLKKVA